MDLKNLNTMEACNQETEIELKHPATGEPLGVYITIIGSESSKMTEKDRQDTTPIAESLNKTTKDAMIRVIEKAIIGTVGWRKFTFDGKEMKFSKTNVEKMYKKDGFDWIPAQVHQSINNLSLFMQG